MILNIIFILSKNISFILCWFTILSIIVVLVVNPMKITPIKTLCGASNNQGTKTKCMKVINTNKGRKTTRERKREHTKFVYPVRSKLT
jgi:hypothetical protein